MSETQSKTVLGPDCRITGELNLDNDALVMGGYDGTLRVTGLLEVAESAQVKGTIIAGTLRVAGGVEGDIIAEDGVEVLPGGSVRGQVYTRQLHIAEGAAVQADMNVGPDAIPGSIAADTTDEAGEQGVADEIENDGDSGINTVSGAVESVLSRRRPANMTSTRESNRKAA